MKKAALLFSVILFCASIEAQSLWKDNTNLFSEHKAKKIGDIVTVRVVESASASQAATTTNKEGATGTVAAGTGIMKFMPGGKAQTNTAYTGNGATTRNNTFTTTVTATIVEVLPNGTYKIEGHRKININNENEDICITGVVRDEDVDRTNTVDSTKLADAQVKYTGKGVVSDSQKPGFLHRLLQAIF